MKIYLLIIILILLFYLAFNFKEGFDIDDGTILFKPSDDLTKYCKDAGCKVIGERDSADNSYIKNTSNLMPFNISSPFVINFYNMLKYYKLNSNCFAEKSKILKDIGVEMQPTKDGYLNFICDKNQIQSVRLNKINYEMEKKTDEIKRDDNFTIKTRVEIKDVDGTKELNGKLGTIVPFGTSLTTNNEKSFKNNYRVLFDEKPDNYDNYKEWCDTDSLCKSIKGVDSDEINNTVTMVIKDDYLKNISGAWWNPSTLDNELKDPDKSYFDFDMLYNNLISMARAANDDKKEVCKCIGNKMFEHVNKYTVNGSSNDAINIKDKLNIETCN